MKHEQLNLKELLNTLQPRDKFAHKGDFGHVLIIGGDDGLAGAPVMAALGALRVGAGLVTIASHSQSLLGLSAEHPEIMTCDLDRIENLPPAVARSQVIVLGPGLGRSRWSQSVYDQAINIELPQVIDADALFFLSQNPTQSHNRILTPHPGEAGTLLDKPSPIAQDDRDNALEALIDKYGCKIVLKGAGTLIGAPSTSSSICNAGNPGMASGGMGDILSGIIAGLIAQGMDLLKAAKLGVMLHASAADIASNNGQRGMIATDLLVSLRKITGT